MRLEIKDVMEQAIRTIRILDGSYNSAKARRDDWEKEHPQDGTFFRNVPSFGLRGIETAIEETCNMIVEWLIEGLDDRELADLTEEKWFLSFWNKYLRYYKFDNSDKNDVITEAPCEVLEILRLRILRDDDVQTRVKIYNEKNNTSETVREDKMDKYYEKDVSYEEKHGIEEEK